METITTEQNIEQQLTEELQKLKKAVAYIGEAKEVAKDSAKLFADMDRKFMQIQEVSMNFKTSVNSAEKKLQEKIASDTRLSEETLQDIHNRIEQLEASHRDELLKLSKSNKKLKVISYFSLGISMLLLVSLIAVVIATINTI